MEPQWEEGSRKKILREKTAQGSKNRLCVVEGGSKGTESLRAKKGRDIEEVQKKKN